jgi:hypothetical protein
MKTPLATDETFIAEENLSSLTGSRRRTLEVIFHHPSAHNLEWREVIALMAEIGDVQQKADNEFVFEIRGTRHVIHKPHTKDLTSPDVIELRHFLAQVGFAPGLPSQAVVHPEPAAPDLLVVVDHHGTKVFKFDVSSDDFAENTIKPYDPHHFLAPSCA